jgi:hypothetical protein
VRSVALGQGFVSSQVSTGGARRLRTERQNAFVGYLPQTNTKKAPSTLEEHSTVLRLFFRDNLWRGEVANEEHFRELVADALGTAVESVAFAALETDPKYLEALREAIAADLETLRADSVDAALRKYLGSSSQRPRARWRGACQ